MTKRKLPVRFTGQHFTIDQELITKMISFADIHTGDKVLDIGAGRGQLTAPLARTSNSVIAIEKDDELAFSLRKRFRQMQNVQVIHADVRKYRFPDEDFKVVSSVPYSMTSYILKMLMYHGLRNFQGGSIVMQFEAARKIVAEYSYNPYVILYRTFYEISIVREVLPESFSPPPTVNSAFLYLYKKRTCIVPEELSAGYLDFLFFMLSKPETKALTAFKIFFRKKQVRTLAEQYGISLTDPVVHLSAEQWAQCFVEMWKTVPGKYHP